MTGGAGFIGSHVVDQLIFDYQVEKVIVVDNFSAGIPDFLKKSINKITLIKGDITDFNLIKEILENVDIVIHEAAQADVAASLRDARTDFMNNVVGTENLLEAALDKDIQRFVFVSSASVYGNNVFSPEDRRFVEDIPCYPLSTYASNKLFGEQTARVFFECYGLPTVSLRYFSIYGPRQIPKYGSHSWVVAIFVINALEGTPITVYGDGNQIRDFTYVEDTAKATILAAIKETAVGKIFNVGSGKPTKIIELANKVREIVGDVPTTYAPLPKGDPIGGYADVTLLRNSIDYVPDTPLEEGIRQYSRWFEKEGFKREL